MKELIRTVISLGMVDENMIREFQRWGLVDTRLVLDPTPKNREQAIKRLNIAWDVTNQELRETSLDVLEEFKKSMREGDIFVWANGEYAQEPVPIVYGVTKYKEYILPWQPVGHTELLVNGKTYLDTGSKKVFMCDVRPAYFDEQQSFVVCKPGVEEVRDGNGG